LPAYLRLIFVHGRQELLKPGTETIMVPRAPSLSAIVRPHDRCREDKSPETERRESVPILP
jgi:hypothetical protein